MIEAESLDGYRLVEPGDLVINMMWAWMGALGVSRYAGIVSPAYSVYRPKPGVEVDTRYFDYLYRSDTYVAEMTRYSRGIHSSRLRIYPNVFLNLRVPQPPLDTQRAIADYLDRETALIDTLIEQQQRLTDLLRERRDAVWARGLASAHSSGIPVQVRRVLASIVDGPFGSSLTSAHYSDDGTRVIRLGNIGMCEFRNSDAAYIPTAYAEELSAHAVATGDVVIAGLGDDKMPLGRATVVPDIGPAIVKADCYRARPTDAVIPSYLAWALSAPQTRSQIMLLARGATRARLNTAVVQQIEIPLPSKTVQAALVMEWSERTAKIDSLIAETEQFIELARERRSALITAAVTGQIDVRKVA
jgi:type I restriction enzyme S subunit